MEKGPLLLDVLGSAWPVGRLTSSKLDLTRYVVATGSDGYAAVLSWGGLIRHRAQRLCSLPQVVVPGDQRVGRYVSGVVALTVRNAP